MNTCNQQIVVAVTNICGAVGKSTFCYHGLAPLMPKAILVAIEDWNTSQAQADLDISARKFYEFAAQLNSDDESDYILDIGASNTRQMFDHFKVLGSTLERITHWIIPTRSTSKDTLDALKTIQLLLDLNVRPESITVIAQAVSDVDSFDQNFSDIRRAAEASSFKFLDQAILFTPVFELIKQSNLSVFEIANGKPSFKAMRKEAQGDEVKLMKIGHQMLVCDLASAAARNFLTTFQRTDIGRLIYGRG